jgi:2-polyprenyl-3-methyl-5-hydroxy-6-metoxy-1,4-benzoquinol methylase
VGSERPSSFYNENLDRHVKPLDESEWLQLYEAAAELLPEIGTDVRIVDVGCGTGRFAALLARMGHERYLGVDFAGARVEAARSYVDGFDFENLDVFSGEFHSELRVGDTFVILEVLEHLENDRDLVERLPVGASVVCSVPNYDAQAHCRFFVDVEQVTGRYEDLLEFSDHRTVVHNEAQNKLVWVFRAERH